MSSPTDKQSSLQESIIKPQCRFKVEFTLSVLIKKIQRFEKESEMPLHFLIYLELVGQHISGGSERGQHIPYP